MERLAIEARGVRKVFARAHPAPKVALDGVDLAVRPGELVALVGPNGAGKTTLLKILATLILPDSGDARVGGASVAAEPEKARAKVGLLIADDRSFYARLTARQNLEFFAALHGFSSAETRDRVARVAALSGLDALDKPYQEQSTGVKQRLALARCLMTGAEILLLDEPTRSLDPEAASRFRASLKDLAACGKTILFTTHSPQEASELAGRVATLREGRLS